MDRLNANQESEFKNDNLGANVKLPNMLLVPAGKYIMGTSDDNIKRLQLKESDWAYEWADNDLFENEQPQHTVSIAAFEIAQYPTTNGEYYQFTSDTGYRLPKTWKGFTFPDEFGNHPVTGVSKFDVQEYIHWLNKRTGLKFRLPTEEEWESAARGKDGRIFPWGNTFDPWRCNTSESAKRGTTPVDTYSPSGDSQYGVADMVGNVWEWTSSTFERYSDKINDGKDFSSPTQRYVVRGGAWYYSRKLARCAVREGMNPDYSSRLIGFRLAKSLT